MRRTYIYWFIVYCFSVNSYNAQKLEANNYLVFKVEHLDKQFIGYYSKAYTLIGLDKLTDFNIIDDSIKSVPNITYQITSNGGLYISESFTDIYTYGCCEYGDIEIVVKQNINGELPSERIKEYESSNRISLSNFESQAGKKFSFKKGTVKYNITVWLVDLEFCVCPLYMETPQQTIYSNQGAYIKNVKAINKPTCEIRKQVKIILQNLVEIELN